MTGLYTSDQLEAIVRQLAGMSSEAGWFEFKVNNEDPEMIGRALSALSNSAALESKPRGFLVWGIDDKTHDIIGTSIDPRLMKRGNEDFIPWLTRLISPQTHLEFEVMDLDGKRVVLASIAAAAYRPVQFSGTEYIRTGSYTKDLRSLPDHERRLWALFSRTPFEAGVALDRVSDDQVFEMLAHEAYFELLDVPEPADNSAALDVLASEKLIAKAPGSGWMITNLGALLFARDLSRFPTVARKAARVIRYDGRDRSSSAEEQQGSLGYAVGFRGLLRFVERRVPSREEFTDGIRKDVLTYPEKVLRELIVNALVHQDFFASGSGPMIEIFEDWFEISNPGRPLVDENRLIDAAPQSRNEALASLMRRMGLCEERGSGWDQVVALIEVYELPAPLVQTGDDYMRVSVFSHRPLSAYSKDDRIRAVYFHTCLMHVRHTRATNTTVRDRFKIADRNSAAASRLIKDALDAGVIASYDPKVGAKAKSYVPFWADPQR